MISVKSIIGSYYNLAACMNAVSLGDFCLSLGVVRVTDPTTVCLLLPCCALQRGGDPVEVFGLLAPEPVGAPAAPAGSQPLGHRHTTSGVFENEPPSPTSSMRSSVCSDGGGVGGKRSRIPTLGNVTVRAGFVDKTNVN
jgi:hypothetical protein